MALDLTGINNKNEYYTNHYISTIFEEGVKDRVKAWSEEDRDGNRRGPVSLLSETARTYGIARERYNGSSEDVKRSVILDMAERFLISLGYGDARSETCQLDGAYELPVYHAVSKTNGNPALWILLASTSNPKARSEEDSSILEGNVFGASGADDWSAGTLFDRAAVNGKNCEDVVTEVFFGDIDDPPRFIMLIGMKSIALLDRNKWNEKRYLEFDLEEIFSRREHSTLQAMAVLLHKTSICPDAGSVVLDDFDEESRRNASGVSANLKYALRECIELLGNEVLYYMKSTDPEFDVDSVDAGNLTLECLRYMYRMLFVFFIESRPELGYAPMKDLSYCVSYSLKSLCDIAEENRRSDPGEVGEGYYVDETLSGLYEMIYNGYPKDEDSLKKLRDEDSIHDVFYVAPLKGHIFDPERTPMINKAKLRNSCMLNILDKMSYAYDSASKRMVRISYSNLGINQLGSVYEALLSYRGFIAKEDLYEVKKAGEKINELDVGYFVTLDELSQYSEDERARYEDGENKGKPRKYDKGTFIYRLAGREREKSASYYTPESLTKCLVKYALEELLKDKTADEILHLTICEPAMGSAAFINEAINQLAEAYIVKKEAEIGKPIKADERLNELQKVKMYIADRNVYGIDLNPVAVELAEVSIWLNSIYEGGYVPWFGTQLVNGNSLIGARRQVYKAQYLTKEAARKWYDTEPDRLPFDKERVTVKTGRTDAREIYHFLLGDPGMCSYGDKVVKGLFPENIKKIQAWNKGFTKPYTENDIQNLLRLSANIDKLWKEHIKICEQVSDMTRDRLSVFGNVDTGNDSHTSIRDKDNIYNEVCKTAEMENAGPYARLKLAMDYWCALWFWPIDKVDLLPQREEFLLDMSLILEGGVDAIQDTEDRKKTKKIVAGQLGLFPTELEEQIQVVFDEVVNGYGLVDIPRLKEKYERIRLASEIAERYKFIHWELEFAEMFSERGGFDLVIGNPPWVKMEWKELNVLSDSNPLITIRNFSSVEIDQVRPDLLNNSETLKTYMAEYEETTAQQNFVASEQNYSVLKGQHPNLYKCFLPQGWMFANKSGVTAYVHPDGVYESSSGSILRVEMYERLKKHFKFVNERKLFADVHHRTVFSLNVYGQKGEISFDNICNLYDPSTIAQCYEGDPNAPIPNLKDNNGEWNIIGHPNRVIHIDKNLLVFFVNLFDKDSDWRQAKLPSLHVSELIDVLHCFTKQKNTLSSLGKEDIYTSRMLAETDCQKAGIIARSPRFPDCMEETIFSSPHIGMANPAYKSSRSQGKLNSDYDSVDLTLVGRDYIQRTNYEIKCNMTDYQANIQSILPGDKFNDHYMLVNREFVGPLNERTLTSCILPKGCAYIETLFGLVIRDLKTMTTLAAARCSLPYDFFVKIIGKAHINYDTNMMFPLLNSPVNNSLICRILLLNCVTSFYSELWSDSWEEDFKSYSWSKSDPRLDVSKFKILAKEWSQTTPLRTDYERRQALIEIDVLTAMALGMTLEQLKTVYNICFPVLQSYDEDTWFDSNGRIVFTINSALSDIGFKRPEWEAIKNAEPGMKFYRTITDNTMPGGPVQRTIEYVAPFDRCDRITDYETAWAFFEEKFGKQ